MKIPEIFKSKKFWGMMVTMSLTLLTAGVLPLAQPVAELLIKCVTLVGATYIGGQAFADGMGAKGANDEEVK